MGKSTEDCCIQLLLDVTVTSACPSVAEAEMLISALRRCHTVKPQRTRRLLGLTGMTWPVNSLVESQVTITSAPAVSSTGTESSFLQVLQQRQQQAALVDGCAVTLMLCLQPDGAKYLGDN